MSKTQEMLDRYEADVEVADLESLGCMQLMSTALLIQAATGEIDLNEVARRFVSQRGVDKNGAWVGFDKAYEIWETRRRRRAA